MKIIVKCWTPESYECVTHALIEFDVALVDRLLAKLKLAEQMETEQELLGNRFMGLEFDSYDPTFIDLGDPAELGLEDDDLDEGFLVLSAENENHEAFDDETGMRPVMQMVMAPCGGKGRVYWYGFDKHGGSDCRAETYSLYEADLREIRTALTS